MDGALTTLRNIGADVIDRATESPVRAALVTLLTTATVWTIVDYQAWLAFGTGGTPPNFRGYMRMMGIRYRYTMSNEDLLDPAPLNTSGTKYLPKLTDRSSKRPRIISRTMPQRQKLEPITAQAETQLWKLIDSMYEKHQDILEIKPSKTEGGSTEAIYAKDSLTTFNEDVKTHKFLGREIAHVHPADRSLHVWLSEADAHEVVRSGWGQRFPGMFFPGGGKGVVSPGWSMVYAPTNEAELKVVEQIVLAGISHVAGVNVMG